MTAAMTVQQEIERKLRAALEPEHLQVLNESGQHSVPPGSESHFKVVVVADAFVGQSRLARHRAVNGILAGELAAGVHALSLHAFSGAEWAGAGDRAPESPPCLGGSKAEAR